MENFLRFNKSDLFSYAVRYMEKLGIPENDAKIVADVLIEADLRGVDSHGLIRIYSYYGLRLEKKYMNPFTRYKILKETDTTVLYDGGNGPGQVVSYDAMTRCIEKAKKSNLAIAVVNNSNHYGIAAYYSMMALKHDMIGISLTNSQPLAAPTYGRTAVIGTNPISIAAPSYNEYPFVLDMATSVVPIGRIKVYEEKGEKIPLGWGIDDSGNVTDDPKKVQSGGPGALMPLGGIDIMRGYKGYGLAIMVEILCAALSGASHLTNVGFPHEPKVSDVSHFFMAINIEAFRPAVDFKKQMDDMIKLLKNSPKAAGHNRIFVAGEKEFEIAKYNEKNGIPILKNVAEELKKNGERIGVPFTPIPVNK
ncbi:MAG: Ldh family oxidoreductase [Actinobacteria bacterium]|nr:Ldh family oxidoreductase [Actinomycetota bacterium]